MDPLIGQTINEKFVIHRLLGEGGMGKVYAGEQLGIGRKVAIKVLQEKLSQIPEVAARFEREAAAAGRIIHPNSVTIFDFGRDPQGRLYLAMEYLEGEALSARLLREQRFSASSAVQVISQVLETLEACHTLGVVHRDLKPDNIFICTQKSQEVVKILDYGIARLADAPEVTKTGQLLGTPYYMSPEQATGKKVTAATDIYSVGIIFFELLTGKPPYQDKSSLDLFRKHLHAPIPSLEEVSPDRRELLCFEPIIKKALAKNPTERFHSAKELRVFLQKAAFDLRSGKYAALWAAPPPMLSTKKLNLPKNSDTIDEFGHQETQGFMDENGDQVATVADNNLGTLELSETMAGRAAELEAEVAPLPIAEVDATLAMSKISLPNDEYIQARANTEPTPTPKVVLDPAKLKRPTPPVPSASTISGMSLKAIVPLGELFKRTPIAIEAQLAPLAEENLPFFTSPSQPKLVLQTEPLALRPVPSKWPLFAAIPLFLLAVAVFFWPASTPSSILVQTSPAGAKVFVNGAESPGTSPLKLELPSGKVRLEVQKAGCTPLKQELTIESNTSQIILALNCP